MEFNFKHGACKKTKLMSNFMKVSKGAKIRNRYNQVSHLLATKLNNDMPIIHGKEAILLSCSYELI